jgi:UDP-N-acetylglucosamine acyltransferase
MINIVGLTRAGFTPDEIATAKTLHRLFYRDGLNASQALEKARGLPEASGRVAQAFVSFAAATKRGLA